MKFNIYYAWIFILSNVTLASNLIQHERFKRERLSKLYSQDTSSNRDQNNPSVIYKKTADSDEERVDNENFIDDVKQMLDYNQNGLMHLMIYLLQLLVLISTIIRSLLYSSFPTTRDPNSGQFLNPVLRISENFPFFIYYVHELDSNVLVNRLIALVSLQFLVQRIRSFFVRLETAKINKYCYKRINTVQLDIGYASEIKYSLSEYIKAFYLLYNHRCYKSELLSGERRLSTIQFNNRLKHLDKIDRIYYYNQINFNDCFECADYLEDYRERDRALDVTRSKSDSSKNSGSEKEISWLRYIFSLELPGRSNYVPKPEHRADPSQSFYLLIFYVLSSILASSLIIYNFVIIIYISLIEKSDSMNGAERLNWSKLLQFKVILGLLSYWMTILVLAANASETGLLAYCGYLCLSRSSKVVQLLKKEIEVHQSHLSRFLKLYDNYHSLIGVEEKYLDHIGPAHSNQYNYSLSKKDSSIVPHSKKLDSQFNAFILELNRKSPSRMRDSSMQMNHIKNIPIRFEYDTFHKVIGIYRSRLSRSEIKCMNENLEYLLDLIEVLQYELKDYKSFFTTIININLLFGIVLLSIGTSMLLKTTESNSILIAIGAGSASIIPMLWSLFIGAVSELAFKNVYRAMLTLMVNELGIFERRLIKRVLNIGRNLNDSKNRSIVVFGHLPLNFGSLTSILIWISSIAFLLQCYIT